MRKGYLLIEVLVVLFIFMLLALFFGRLWRTFIFEVPRGYRLVQESSTLNNLVSHLRADVASAKTLSQSTGDSLLIETTQGVISYRFEQGKILRQKQAVSEDSMSWSAPHGKIEWQVRNTEKNGSAVEVITYIEDRDLGHIQKKMANSNLFFAGSIWETAK